MAIYIRPAEEKGWWYL